MTDMDVADAITDDSLCPSCFHLDTAAAVEYDSPDIFVDQRSLAVVASRSFDHIQTTAASGCHLCAFLLKVVDFFGFNPEADRDHSNIVLRLPIGFGNPEISFPVYDSKLHAQLYGSTRMSCSISALTVATTDLIQQRIDHGAESSPCLTYVRINSRPTACGS